MVEAIPAYGFTSAAYVVAAVLFILALGGLSGQESAKRAIWYGIVGMGLAVLATLFGPGWDNWWLSILMIALGGVGGYVLATRVQMTEMPQLIAAMHSLVGLAAVLIGVNAQLELGRVIRARLNDTTDVFTGFAAVLAQKSPAEIAMLKVEVALGIFIGAVTFTGSIVAYGKLAGKIDGKPKKLPGGHMLNLSAAILSLLLLIFYVAGWGPAMLWLILLAIIAGFIGWHLIMG
ncbi:NAD(P)(+) transhydrogenase (Re/Si-specific) subunit beta, partial [Paracoccus sp. (in: a-proteobacteria)]|uniref:NAD(P)(+) transhydrogenase (Re/Si-specific) subunit beta n=1 Tax=Paracoccus sp. TaxID=267 RepID=UPI0026E0D4DC